MSEAEPSRRPYRSQNRDAAARKTRAAILEAARHLFAARSVDEVRLAEIAEAAGVATSTLYATFGSRDGILRALMEAALFGPHYAAALRRFDAAADPVRQVEMSAEVARAVYEGEARELGEIRLIAVASPIVRSMEREFDAIRFERQKARVEALFAAGRAREGLTPDQARRILWALTSRDLFRMLVQEAGWTADAYEDWLRGTIRSALVASD